MRTFSDILRVVAMVLLGYLVVGVQTINAQVQLPPYVKPQFLDQNGRPLSNGCLFTYQSGTNTPQATYTDFTGSTPNPNPIQLDGSGRPPLGTDIWLGSGSYRFKLVSQGGTSCSTGIQQWLEDGISSSTGTILSANNTWTGQNTFDGATIFNGAVTMNVGFTSNGPSNLTAGGSLAGTFSGSPTLSGNPNFTGTPQFENASFTGQIFDSVTGVPPFVINSNLEVMNLNANLLENCDWASPCAIGGTAPNTAIFTTLRANTSFNINGSTNQVGIQGTDTHLFTSGTIASGAAHGLCTDANGGATTTGCATSGFSQIESATSTSTTCPTASSAGATCGFNVSWPTAFPDTNYSASCTGLTITGAPYVAGWAAISASGGVVTISNGQGSQAVASGYGSLMCVAVHP